MRLSNNAIRFLIAQYRAVYQRAWVSGLASAAMVTAGLAGGQSVGHAAALDDLSKAKGDITITGVTSDSGTSNRWESLSVSGTGALPAPAFNLTVTGGAFGSNTVSADSGAATLKSSKKLILAAGAADQGITFKSGKASETLTAEFDEVRVSRGTLALNEHNSAAKAALAARSFTVGGAGSTPAQAMVVLGKSATLGQSIAAGDLSGMTSLTLSQGGAISSAKPQSSSVSNVTINAPTFKLNGGDLSFVTTTSSKTYGATAYVNLVQGVMDGGSINLDQGSYLDMVFADDALKITQEGKEAARSLAFNSGSLKLQGNFKIKNGGTVTIGDAVKLTGGDNAVFALSGSNSKSSPPVVLKTSLARLHDIIGTTRLQTKNAVLSISTDENLDLSQFMFVGGSAPSAGKIAAGLNTVIEADNISITTDGGRQSTGVNVRAREKLTLGTSNFMTQPGIGFGKFEARNVEFIDSAAGKVPFFLKNALTLSSTKEAVAYDGSPCHEAMPGTITGDFILQEELTIKGGIYQTSSDITIGKDHSINLTSWDGAASQLIFTGGTLTLEDYNNQIMLAVNGEGALLDLTKAEIVKESGKNLPVVTIDNGGMVKFNEDGANALINPESDSGGKLIIRGDSSLDIDGSMTISSGKFGNIGATDATVIIANTATLGVGNLTVTDADLGIFIRDTATIKADNIKLETGSDDPALLGSGNFNVTENITAVKGDGTLSDIAVEGRVVLGSADSPADSKGTVGSNIILGTGYGPGNLLVAGGSWNTGDKKIDLNDGTIVIGGQVPESASGGASGAAGSASLTVKDLNATSGDMSIGQGGSLSADRLTASDANISLEQGGSASIGSLDMSSGKGSINVTGSLNITGKSEGADGSGPVKLQPGSLSVGNGGELSFDKAALEAFQVGNGGGMSVQSGTFAPGSIELKPGSQVNMDFGAGDVFTADKLEELRKIFGKADGSLVDGVINVGSAHITGITDKIHNVQGTPVVKWEDIAGYADVYSTTTAEQLGKTVVIDFDESDSLRGNFGALRANEGTDTVNLVSSTTLAAASANNGYFVSQGKDAATAQATDVSLNFGTLTLKGSGALGKVSLARDAAVAIDAGAQGAVTFDGDLTGRKGTMLKVAAGTADITGKLAVDAVRADSGTVINAQSIDLGEGTTEISGDLTAQTTATFKGSTTVKGKFTAASATFAGTTELHGDNTVQDLSIEKSARLLKGQTTAENIEIKGTTDSLTLAQGAQLQTKSLSLTRGARINAGEAIIPAADTAPATSGSTGWLFAENAKLNGGSIVASPDFGTSASIVAIRHLAGDRPAADSANTRSAAAGSAAAATTAQASAQLMSKAASSASMNAAAAANAAAASDNDSAGVLDGSLFALRNAVIALGTDSKDAITHALGRFFDASGALSDDSIGALAYAYRDVVLGDGSRLVVDKDGTNWSVDARMSLYDGSDLYLGKNSVLAVSDESLSRADTAAVTFAAQDAQITVDESSKVILTGTGFAALRDMKIFGTAAAGGTVALNQDLAVESINGLYSGVLKSGANIVDQQLTLSFNSEAARELFSAVSDPVMKTLITWGQRAHNPEAQDEAQRGQLSGRMAYGYAFRGGELVKVDDQGKTIGKPDDKELNEAGLKIGGRNNYTVIGEQVFLAADNAMLNHATGNNGTAIDAEVTARLGDLGGMMQTAWKASSATTSAIASHLGTGTGLAAAATHGAMPAALVLPGSQQSDPATGNASMWLSPVFINSDSDGFAADNKEWGTDISLNGLALGADFALQPDFTIGAMFSIGNGDADGKGIGSAVSNDFDYYSLGAYAAWTKGELTVAGDLTWTQADNDISASTGLGQISTSVKSSAVSAGVTGQYHFEIQGYHLTPHAGLRVTAIDADSYAAASDKGDLTSASADRMNVVSIPVGITGWHMMEFDDWTVVPAIDLTVTAHAGNKNSSSSVSWTGVDNLSTDLNTQVLDDVNWSFTTGVSASNGAVDLGLSLGYTGSSSTSELGINAQLSYRF
ncbi:MULTISPECIES: autotransporter outer membrane beta-barrel domain-containing protein [unclassified Anaerobiospirillum]|uniref:autotransporter domain-containing protein n=1 Tax=unclassified Anaerobiospirillum TaxID=2647410 RepID=UPI001FF4A91B|nr:MULTISPECIES: autotransporter outer membrane beta-barrel domain-containing protein [unclassified Anaerobiospirillum]MCK0535372.1 autotransporter domain-containing protein [Anaerobiospirillum sp. NML120511]MCK0540338.1 autotransporter domain-containing protein [Anaerobiospirillum sp. NML02-A-032]